MTASHPQIAPPSERRFGVSFAAVFAALAARLWWQGRTPLAGTCLAVAAGLLILAFFAPRVLRLPNRAWFVVGIRLSKIVSPIVIGAMFLLIVTPVGLLRRALGRDPLRVRRRRRSYWIKREPPGPTRGSFTQQF
jgi:hypothetical protein